MNRKMAEVDLFFRMVECPIGEVGVSFVACVGADRGLPPVHCADRRITDAADIAATSAHEEAVVPAVR